MEQERGGAEVDGEDGDILHTTMTQERKNIPNHVAIIPDGNRRWARARGLAPWEGHEAGAENTEVLIRKAREMGIRELSLWGSSLENLKKRPLEESRVWLRIYETYFMKLLEGDDIHTDQVRVRFIGHFEEQFPESLKVILRRINEATKGYDRFFLNFFFAYNGDDEMIAAIRSLVDAGVRSESIDGALLQEHLMTREVSPVDYLIRTGDEPHLSAGFLMWQTQNSQLYFAKECYPDFGVEAFERALADFGDRERRFGE
jgi:undecaprenyl diphosphate synthase